MGLNGKTVIASALTTAASIIAFGVQSASIKVQITCILSATVIIVAAFAHDAVKSQSREKTVQRVAEGVAAKDRLDG